MPHAKGPRKIVMDRLNTMLEWLKTDPTLNVRALMLRHLKEYGKNVSFYYAKSVMTAFKTGKPIEVNGDTLTKERPKSRREPKSASFIVMHRKNIETFIREKAALERVNEFIGRGVPLAEVKIYERRNVKFAVTL